MTEDCSKPPGVFTKQLLNRLPARQAVWRELRQLGPSLIVRQYTEKDLALKKNLRHWIENKTYFRLFISVLTRHAQEPA